MDIINAINEKSKPEDFMKDIYLMTQHSDGWKFIQKHIEDKMEVLQMSVNSDPIDTISETRGALRELALLLDYINECNEKVLRE